MIFFILTDYWTDLFVWS